MDPFSAVDAEPSARPNPVDGTSLAEAIRQAEQGHPQPLLAAVSQRLALVIRVAGILAKAHDQGRVHGYLTPQVIHVDRHGDIRIVDWLVPKAAVGQPNDNVSPGTRSYRISHASFYLSPEQARGAPADAAGDRYALAAICHHLVVGRPPLVSTTGTRSWARKELGDIDPLSRAEATNAPPGIMAVLERALAADPGIRHEGALSFAADLAQVMDSALAATAVKPPRRSRLPILVATLAVLAGAITLGSWMSERRAGPWGPPVSSVAMSDPAWLTRWDTVKGSFVRDGAALVTGPGNEHVLAMTERTSPHAAIEFLGRIRPGAQPGDLSVLWLPTLRSASAGGVRFDHDQVIKFQVGAYDNRYATIIYRDRLAQAPFRLEPGRSYRIRAEIDGDRLSLDVDGVRVCESRTLFPLPTGHLALYGYYPGKEFSTVRVFRQPPQPLVSPLAIGDAMFSDGLYDAAERQYTDLMQRFVGDPLAQAAQFRLGLARERVGQTQAADSAWASLAGSSWGGQVALMVARRQLSQGSPAQAISFAEQVFSRHPDLRAQALELWSSAVSKSAGNGELAGLDQWTASWDRLFREDALTSGSLAEAYLAAGRPRRVIELMPGDRLALVARAVMGDTEEFVTPGSHDRQAVLKAYLVRGDYDRIVSEFSDQRWVVARSLIRLGRSAELAERTPQDVYLAPLAIGDWAAAERSEVPAIRAEALLVAGRIDEAEQAVAGQPDASLGSLLTTRIALLRGQARQVVASAEANGVSAPDAQAMLAIECFAAGQSSEANGWIARIQRNEDLPSRLDLDVAACLLPAMAALDGSGAVVARQVLEDIVTRQRLTHARRPWHLAALALGTIDEAGFRAQPMQTGLDGALLLAQGMRAELAGDNAVAETAYRTWLTLPQHRRALVRDPVAERFVAWRLARPR